MTYNVWVERCKFCEAVFVEWPERSLKPAIPPIPCPCDGTKKAQEVKPELIRASVIELHERDGGGLDTCGSI